VDSGSSDATVAIAQEAGATVIQTEDWPGFGPQKNRALQAAGGDWILSLDADERIPAALREEILEAIAANTHAAYTLPRLSSFCGRFVHHSGWYPDYIVRLFRRDSAAFSSDLVHESVKVLQGSTGKLRTAMIHYSYPDDETYLRKLQQYSTLGAKQAFAAGKRAGLGTAILHACSSFLRSYIFRKGFLDGKAGLMVALSSAESTYHKYFKLMLLTERENK
jgi:glycosyltransferase involved in cell wall biosynthesis